MRALAEFIMRGRLQAVVVALIGNWVPLLTPSTVALVTLRTGWRNGVLILLWGLLPALLMLGFSQIDPLVPIVVVSGALLTFFGALVLRHSASWGHGLMGIIALATLLALVQQLMAGETIETLRENLNALAREIQAEGAEEAPAPLGAGFVVGLIAYVMAFTGVLGLIIGRWWQALVYNPGGFGAEFQTTRLNQPQALVCLVAGLYSLFQGQDYAIWSSLFTLPLLFVGLAIVHRVANLRKWATPWLVLFYAALVIWDPVSQLLVVLAFVDTWLNFRGRVKPKD